MYFTIKRKTNIFNINITTNISSLRVARGRKVNVSGANEDYMTVSTEIHRKGRTELSYMF